METNATLGFDQYGLSTSVGGKACLPNGKDGCTPYENGFFDNEMSWGYSLWFNDSPNVTLANSFQNQVLTLDLTGLPLKGVPNGPGVGSYAISGTNNILPLSFVEISELTLQQIASGSLNKKTFSISSIALVPVNGLTITYQPPDLTDPNSISWPTTVKTQAISPGSLMPDIMQKNNTSNSNNDASPLDSFYRRQIYSGAAGY